MGYPTKIATCCFCGSKAALTLDKGRHELSCASCGAPLRDIKMLPKAKRKRPAISHVAPKLRGASGESRKTRKTKQKPKRAKRVRWFKEMAEEIFDFVEDIFD